METGYGNGISIIQPWRAASFLVSMEIPFIGCTVQRGSFDRQAMNHALCIEGGVGAEGITRIAGAV